MSNKKHIIGIIDDRLKDTWEPCKIGTVGELYVALDLMERGFEPYLPVPGRSAPYDMLALDAKTGSVFPVSVKTRSCDNGEDATYPQSDYHARKGGAIVARVKYMLPDHVRRLAPPPTREEMNRRYDVATMSDLAAAREEALSAIEVLISAHAPGELVTTADLRNKAECTGTDMRTLYRAIHAHRFDHVLFRVRKGVYVRRRPPGDKVKRNTTVYGSAPDTPAVAG